MTPSLGSRARRALLPRFACVLVGLAGTALLAPASSFAAGHGGFGSAHGGGWHGGGPGWHGGGGWGHRGGYYRPGYFWGGVGLGLGLGAVGYYNGWWGPYGYSPYVYDNGYYVDAPVVVNPPVAVDPAPRVVQPMPAAPRAPDPIFYPNKGQSAAQTETDRRDCNRWATTQSGAMADASIFQRATLACMEGRGYTVK